MLHSISAKVRVNLLIHVQGFKFGPANGEVCRANKGAEAIIHTFVIGKFYISNIWISNIWISNIWIKRIHLFLTSYYSNIYIFEPVECIQTVFKLLDCTKSTYKLHIKLR